MHQSKEGRFKKLDNIGEENAAVGCSDVEIE
jgi:hypothetical protein